MGVEFIVMPGSTSVRLGGRPDEVEEAGGRGRRSQGFPPTPPHDLVACCAVRGQRFSLSLRVPVATTDEALGGKYDRPGWP